MSKRIGLQSANIFKLKIIIVLIAAIYQPALYAAPTETADKKPINTKLPEKNRYDISAGSLSKALSNYAGSNGLTFSFDPILTNRKTTRGLQGSYQLQDGFDALLKGTGLEAAPDSTGGYLLRHVAAKENVSTPSPIDIETPEVAVRAKRFYEVGPLPGLGLTKEQIPANVQSISAEEIKEAHSLSLADLFNKKLQSVTVNDYQGNPFQMDVQYRGFTAGPQIGTPQGLSVFFDGIRVNEPFGDVVNWDMIPMNAIASVDVFPGSNPVFGLNTLGGAFTVKTKDGFNHSGLDAEVLAGSYGRKQLQVEGGWNNGDFALFGAGSFFMEDGWRENSPSKVNQFFGKASYRGEKLDLSFSALLVGNDLVGNGLLPSEMYAQDRNASFSSEDTTKNRLQQFQLSANYFVNDSFSITGQVYRRNSDRKQIGADVFTDYDLERAAKFRPADDDEYTCLLRTTNQYGIPDYMVISVNRTAGEQIFFTDFFNEALIFQNINIDDPKYAASRNAELSDRFLAGFRDNFNSNRNHIERFFYDRGVSANPPPPEEIDYDGFGFPVSSTAYGISTFNANPLIGANTFDPTHPLLVTAFDDAYFTTIAANGDKIQNFVFFEAPVNNENCRSDTQATNDFPGPYNDINPDGFGYPYFIDGAALGEAGYVEGTPTGLITTNEINQIVDGASVQFNWNLEQHKFMVGASIDAAGAKYTNTQQLGFLDKERNVYLDPNQANPQFGGAYYPLANNDFSGTNTTMSVYFSETWSPVDAWNFNVSGRYNQTKTKNKIATRYGFGAFSVGDLRISPDEYDLCTTDAECAEKRNYQTLDIEQKVLNPAETEEFSYYSFNPSLGATWQATENLNIYGNWSKGTRTPSVIELGCALDHTPAGQSFLSPGQSYTVPKSVAENRQCYLPTTLSGDPYLPQIKATSYDIGLRGTLWQNLQWNLGAYQTDLKDDIYFIAVPGGGGGSGFFDTIGKTRRRGVEAGLSGQQGKWGFSLNYALTDATFENDFFMYSEDNSSATRVPTLGPNAIKVTKGSTMPGVPLHNLNASLSYQVTPKWRVGMSAVVHSESYVRGNENNEHKVGETQYRLVSLPSPTPGGLPVTTRVARQTATNPGKLPGYATFNFQTGYKFNAEWTATMLINNVFDKEYFSAGRLGRNPFSPSINGAISVSGYNHNSSDWLSTNFISPSAPRGIWFSLNWQFDPKKAY